MPLSAAAMLSESRLVTVSYCYDVVLSARTKTESKMLNDKLSKVMSGKILRKGE